MATNAAGEAGKLSIKPMDQFIVSPLFNDGIVTTFTFTNAAFWMLTAAGAIFLVLIVGPRHHQTVPTRAQSVAELIYTFVYDMVKDTAGKDGLKFFPYVMTLFMFILTANILGLLPFSYTSTAHISVTATLAVAVFVTVSVLGFVKNGPGFLSLFWVSSAPLVLRPILAIIEIISYFVRPVSHSIRLAGNLMAGHAVLKVFAGFASALGLFAFLPIFGIVAIYGLEVMVAVIQAYVFTILTCVYLKDALHPHH